MKLPSTKTLVSNVACLVALGWIYGGDLTDALQARGAEVSAFLAPPRVGWPAGVLVATVGVLGVVAWGLWRGRGEDFKGYRLLPILLVSALFMDLAFSESQLPMPSTDVAVLSLRHFQQQAQALATEQAVPADPAVLRALLDELGEPPYLVRGTRAGAWSLQVRENCEGPIAEAPGTQAGTLLYCVSPGREQAWITLVGLRAGERFGAPAVLSVGGEPHVALVRTASVETEEEEPGAALPFQVIPGGGEGRDGR
jgi:hypothetical protein